MSWGCRKLLSNDYTILINQLQYLQTEFNHYTASIFLTELNWQTRWNFSSINSASCQTIITNFEQKQKLSHEQPATQPSTQPAPSRPAAQPAARPPSLQPAARPPSLPAAAIPSESARSFWSAAAADSSVSGSIVLAVSVCAAANVLSLLLAPDLRSPQDSV